MIEQGQSLKKTFLKYMLPSVAAQWVFALYTMVDGMFVARGVSELALSAVNIAMPFVTLLFSVSLMFAVGASTIIAILFGQGKKEEASRVYTQNLIVMALISLLITAGVLLNLDAIARFLGATDATLAFVKEYVGTIACFSLCFMVAYSFEILIKTDGHPKLATIFVTTGAVLNCILDWLFVIVLKQGVFGAAFATGLSQAVLVILYLCYFLGPKATLRFKRFRFSGRDLWRTVRLGLPSGVTEFSAGIVIFLFNNAIIAHISEEAVVSYTIVAYVNTIVVMSITGIAQGFQPLVSFYHGQGNRAVCEKLLRYGLIAATVFAVGVTVPTWLAAPAIVSIFVSPAMQALREYSVEVFRIFSASFLVLGYNIVIGSYFTAIEREKSSLIISLGRGFVFISLSLAVLTRLFGGPGIWWSALASETLCLALTLGLFAAYRRGLRTAGRLAGSGA